MMQISDFSKLVAACERYLSVANSHGDDITINSVPRCEIGGAVFRFEGHAGETWEKELWIDMKGTFHIVDPKTKESILNYADEMGWSADEVRYIKTGKNSDPAFWIMDIKQVSQNVPESVYGDNLQATRELMDLLDDISDKPMLTWEDYVSMYENSFFTYKTWDELVCSEEEMEGEGMTEEECRAAIGKTIWRLPCGWFVQKV